MDSQLTNKLKNIQSRLEIENSSVQRESVLRISSLLCDPSSNHNTVRNDHLLQILLRLLSTNSIFILESVLNSLWNAVQYNRIQRTKLIETLVNSLPAVGCGHVGVDLIIGEVVRHMVQVDVLTTMKNQAILSVIKSANLESLVSFVKYIELSLTDEAVDLPVSLYEQRWKAFSPLLQSIIIRSSTLSSSSTSSSSSSSSTYQLIHQISRIAMNNNMFQLPILVLLSTIVFSINNNNNNNTMMIDIIRDLVELVRFTDDSLLDSFSSGEKQQWNASIHRVALLIVQNVYNNSNGNDIGCDVGVLLSLLFDLVDCDDSYSSLLWSTTVSNSQSTNIPNAPLIFTLALVVPKLQRQHQLRVLQLFTLVLDESVININILPILLYPLIRLQSSIPNDTLENQINVLNISLIRDIEIIINKQQQQQVKQSTNNNNNIQLDIVISESISLINISYQWFLSTFNNSNNNNNNRLITFFDGLESKLNSIKSQSDSSSKSLDCDLLLLILCSFLFYRNQEFEMQSTVRCRALVVLSLITSVDSLQAIPLLPLLIHRLRHEESGVVIKQLYHSLTDLAANRICYPVVVKMINDMASNKKSLMPIAIRLMTRIWMVNDKALTSLQTMLTAIRPDGNGCSTVEERIASAASIRQVCSVDSDAGQEMIAPLSALLCRDSHPTVLSLALDALSSLCKNEVLGFVSAWNVIKKNFTRDVKRQSIVSQHLVQFFGNGVVDLKATPIDIMDEKKADIIRDIVTRLWEFTQCSDVSVEREAYITLGAYAEVDPNLIQYDFNSLISTNTTTNMTLVEELLKRALVKELNEKRTLKSAHTNLRQTKSIRIGEAVDSVEPKLYQEYCTESRVGITHGVQAGLLWSFSNLSALGQEGNRESKKMIALRHKAFSKMLIDLTSLDLSSSRADDFTSRMLTIGGWNRFMSEMMEASLRNEQTRMSLAKDKQPLAPNLVRDKVFDDIFKLLLDHVEQISNNQITYSQSENIVLALAGLGRSLPLSSYNKFEQVVSKLLDWINQEKPVISKGACFIGISCLIASLNDESPLVVQSRQALLWGESTDHSQSKFSWYLAIAIAIMNLSNAKKPATLIEPLLNVYRSKLIHCLDIHNLSDTPENVGLVLSIGYVVSALKEINNQQSENLLIEISAILEAIYRQSQELSKSSPQLFGATLLVLPLVKTVLFKLSKLDYNQIKELISQLDNNRSIYPKHKLFTFASHALLIQLLASESFSLDIDYIESQFKQYINTLSQQNLSANDRIACIVAAAVFLGAPILSQDASHSFNGNLATGVIDFINSNPARRKECQSLINQLVESLIQIYDTSDDSKVVRFAAASLGALSIPTSSSSSNDTPDNLDHLPDELLVKKLFNLLNSKSSSNEQIASVFSIFSQVDGSKLPIVNWGSIIKRIFTSNQNQVVRSKCIEFCAKNILLSTCSNVYVEWISIIQSFNSSMVKETLLRSIPLAISHVAASRVDSLFALLENVTKVYDNVDDDNDNNNKSSKNLELTWSVIYDGLQAEHLPDDMRIRFKKLAIDYISKSIPSPFVKSNNNSNNTTMVVDRNVVAALDHCASGLSALPDKKFGFQLISGSLNNAETFQNSLKMNYVFARWAKLAKVPITLQSIATLKQWCFASNGSPYQQMLQAFLPSIVESIFIGGQPTDGSRPTLNELIIDFLDCLKLSPKHSIGIELLSTVITCSLSSININILFTQLELNNLDINLSNILAYSLPIFIRSFNLDTIVTDRLSSLIKDKFNSIEKSEKAILVRSLYSVLQSISAVPEPSQSWILNGLQ
ncbi:armadillo-like helical domain-containing protein [Heterostelium album PN500]|uniref:Armadillo-like helical domain-containing protein n=1 Tax=Heterostelium pallidum (strain ATCC 26659 / Pp 5 / PN500) TaxID=670386 RepID=D3BT54_HETP5|nr:armadillo-like helical domain-containing protein [Heterostelium album PN500]EFA75271.1 armadillo-like helical domain-containing protein [Heterostelium album PN500]|eukprot:XP_020427405.1 armadillo-like helical domain-containing protein [Heterostelium album PN500]